jgi:hypothetical protein
MTSSAAPENNVVKTHKAALSAGSVSLSRDLSSSAEAVQFAASRNETGEGFVSPAFSRYGNSAVLIGDDRFTKVKKTKTRKDIPNIIVTSVRKIMIRMIVVRPP